MNELDAAWDSAEYNARRANRAEAERNELRAEIELLRRVRDAADCIKHWHDSGEDGMVVSAEHVRKLWAALDAARSGG
jgi:hypothetical protein